MSLRKAQDRFEQFRKPCIDVVLAQHVAVLDTLLGRSHQAGFAQDTKVIGQGRLGHVRTRRRLGARHAVVLGEKAPDNTQPLRIREGCKHPGQCDFVSRWVDELHHSQNIASPLNSFNGSLVLNY
jgi:hypothetical protein